MAKAALKAPISNPPVPVTAYYEYLDPDVAKWLKEDEPQPRQGRNWHSWLNAHYGLPELIQPIYILIGVARTRENIRELRRKMAELNGRIPMPLTLYLAPESRQA